MPARISREADKDEAEEAEQRRIARYRNAFAHKLLAATKEGAFVTTTKQSWPA